MPDTMIADDLERGLHSRSSSSSSLTNELEYINQFAYNNARGSLNPKTRSRANSSENPFADDPENGFLEDEPKYENYPKPITKRSIYTITGLVLVVWLTALLTYSRLPRHLSPESAYKGYDTATAFGINNNNTAIATKTTTTTTTSSSSSSSNDVVASFSGLQTLDLSAYRSGKFFVFDNNYHFIDPPSSHKSSDDEGLYYGLTKENFVAKKISDSEFSKTIVPRKFTYESTSYRVFSIYPTFDLKTVIVTTNEEVQWRHSRFSHFFIYDVASQNFQPLYTINDSGKEVIPKISFAQWSPNYNYISFVYQNNIYLKTMATGKITQVTNDGGENIFNGKPDWVYEEEVTASDRLLWWSPNEKNFVFVKTNDTNVPVYEIDYYTKNVDSKYPTHKPIKYPKPGYSNPILDVFNYNIENDEKHLLDHSDNDGQALGKDYIVYDVFWLNDNDFICKQSDRESNILHYRLYDHKSGSSKVVRKVDAVKEFGGWIDKTHVVVIPANPNTGRDTDGYVDIIVDKNGFSHLAYFKSSSSSPSIVLSQGDFDDKTSHLAFDYDKNILYFTSTKQSSMSSHLYSVLLDSSAELTALTNDEELGYYEASFSPNSKYLSLNYKGPRMPTQKIVDLHAENSQYFTDIKSITDTSSADKAHTEYAVPSKQYLEIEVDVVNKVSVNVLETKPQNFDPKKKYPLLVNYYGGPGSQRVEAKYGVGFSEVVSSSLDAIVLLIDPRGTDSKGWNFKKWARNAIGEWEAPDIIAATKKYIAENDYVDADRTVGWGWSYSGFVTLKLLEMDTEQVFKYGAAVAPVTDWRLYDSIYTERYINTPEHDHEGYKFATVGSSDDFKFENFKQKKRFLIMHGTGDDNVHIQNTYALLDKLNLAGVENFDMKIFPDSDHSIYYHNANTIVYDKLFNWFNDAFNGSLDKLSG